MAGNIIFPNDIDVAVLIHGDLRIYRATSGGGEHLRPRKRGPTVARATEPNGEVTSVALPNNADVAGGIHCDLRDGVESRDNRLGEVYWRGESITPIVRAAEEHIRVLKKSGLSCQTTLMVPPESTAMRGLKEKPALLETPFGAENVPPSVERLNKILEFVSVSSPHHVDVPTQIHGELWSE